MIVRRLVNGLPRQFMVMKLNMRCSMLVPFGGARWVVTDGDVETRLLRESIELHLPGSHAVAIGTAGVGRDEQRGRLRESLPAHLVPPASNRFNGELRRVGGITNIHPALVVRDVVEALGDGHGVFAELAVDEVVDAHSLG
jgi:hypothetical protein